MPDDIQFRRVWVSPIKVQRIMDRFQRQHILKIWLRWPTYLKPVRVPDTYEGRCGACGAGAGESHADTCPNYLANLIESGT